MSDENPKREKERGKVSDVFLISVDRGQRTALERSFESQCRTNMEGACPVGLPAPQIRQSIQLQSI